MHTIDDMKRWGLKPEDTEDWERWRTLIEIGSHTELRLYRCERREIRIKT